MTPGVTRCVFDRRACPHGGCADTLCCRHEFVPVAYPNPKAVEGSTPARAARNTPSGAAMRADSPAPGAQSGPGTSSRRLWQV